jgi:hypothetical protein
VGAGEEAITAAEVHLESDDLEAELTAAAEKARGLAGSTIIAWELGTR